MNRHVIIFTSNCALISTETSADPIIIKREPMAWRPEPQGTVSTSDPGTGTYTEPCWPAYNDTNIADFIPRQQPKFSPSHSRYLAAKDPHSGQRKIPKFRKINRPHKKR